MQNTEHFLDDPTGVVEGNDFFFRTNNVIGEKVPTTVPHDSRFQSARQCSRFFPIRIGVMSLCLLPIEEPVAFDFRHILPLILFLFSITPSILKLKTAPLSLFSAV